MSRFAVVFPLRKDESEEIARKLETHVFSILGPPRILISDGATNLNKSARFKALANLYKFKLKVRSPYSSRSLGLTATNADQVM